jgi:hypothetical protein
MRNGGLVKTILGRMEDKHDVEKYMENVYTT